MSVVGTRTMPIFFFFNDTATTEIYTLSLHDALPIFDLGGLHGAGAGVCRAAASEDGREHCARRPGLLPPRGGQPHRGEPEDRKSTRLNSSHANISYAVFCLKKKKKTHNELLHLVINP